MVYGCMVWYTHSVVHYSQTIYGEIRYTVMVQCKRLELEQCCTIKVITCTVWQYFSLTL
jgi:hypothetical protein